MFADERDFTETSLKRGLCLGAAPIQFSRLSSCFGELILKGSLALVPISAILMRLFAGGKQSFCGLFRFELTLAQSAFGLRQPVLQLRDVGFTRSAQCFELFVLLTGLVLPFAGDLLGLIELHLPVGDGLLCRRQRLSQASQIAIAACNRIILFRQLPMQGIDCLVAFGKSRANGVPILPGDLIVIFQRGLGVLQCVGSLGLRSQIRFERAIGGAQSLALLPRFGHRLFQRQGLRLQRRNFLQRRRLIRCQHSALVAQ